MVTELADDVGQLLKSVASEEAVYKTMFVRTRSRLRSLAQGHDEFAPAEGEGVTAQAVYQAHDNANDITITHEFASVDAAQAFAASSERRTRCRAQAWWVRQRSGRQQGIALFGVSL